MRLRITASVEGAAVAPRLFVAEAPGVTVGFDTDKKHRVTGIWAETKVANYRDFLPSIVPGTGTREKPHRFAMPVPPQADELRAVLQYIESLGSFWLGIRRIAWSEAEVRWMPDSEAERRELPLFSVKSRLDYPDTPVPFAPEVLARLLLKRAAFNYLIIPMSFYREGVRDLRVHRNVSAFYNFYFFLEDLYGCGKWRNADIIEAFRGSAQVTAAVTETYNRLEEPSMAQNKSELRALVTALKCDYSPSGLIEFLVMARGELHHFSQRSTRPKGHPLNQMEWRSVAFFGMSVCVSLVQLLANGARPDSE